MFVYKFEALMLEKHIFLRFFKKNNTHIVMLEIEGFCNLICAQGVALLGAMSARTLHFMPTRSQQLVFIFLELEHTL